MPKQKKQDIRFALDMAFEEALQRNSDVRDLSEEMQEEQIEKAKTVRATPFLKWVGGKRSIIQELKNRLPATFNNYFEPFVGGGALFFEMQPQLKKAFLSDANLDLVITYNVIKEEPEKLIEALQKHQKLHCEEYYYRQRSKHDLTEALDVAARMIYLNKTCFNGLWRVNKKGEFNVPMGKYSNPGIVQEDNIRACSRALQPAAIEYKSYENIEPEKGDFVYLDPPYHPANDTSFTAYASGDFSEKDQQSLAGLCTALHKKGVHVMLSNSNTEFIRNLYKSSIFKIAIVSAPRMINCKPDRRNAVEEVLITNY